MVKPVPKDKEIKLDPKKYIVSQTDPRGVIEYGNDYFIEISKYSESELLGQPHNIVRHPDMPKIIFKMMWDRIKKGENIMAVVKNLAKDGSFYWVITEFEPRRDSISNKILSYTAFRKAAPQEAIDTMGMLYKKLLELEKKGGMEASEEYLRELLDKKDLNYDEYVCTLVGNRGMFKTFFQSMKTFFSN